MKRTLSYSQQQDKKNYDRLTELTAGLPPFCRQFFRGI